MSGPKGYHYEVVSAEELARRAHEAARQRCDTMEHRFELMAAEADVWPGMSLVSQRLRTETPQERASTVELEVRAEAYGRAIEELRAARAEAMGTQARRLVAESLGAIDFSLDLDLSHRPAQPSATSATAASAQPSTPTLDDNAKADLSRRIAALSDLIAAHPDVMDDCSGVLDAVRESLDHGAGTATLKALRAAEARVARGVRDDVLRRQFEHERDRTLASFADLSGDEAGGLRGKLACAPDRHTMTSICDRLQEVRRRQLDEADRAYVLAAAEAALAELGYDVDVQPSDDATEVLATSAKYPSHALKLLFTAADGSFYSNVVALGDTSPVVDADVERSTCADVASLTRSLAERGVRASMQFHRAPGEVPVERASRRAATKRARAARPQAREQSL